MPRSLHISLFLGLNYEYNRAVLRGLVTYARPSKRWIFSFITQQELLEASPTFDGFIGNAANSPVSQRLLTIGKPAVNISNLHENPDLPRVGADDALVGQAGARYFLDRGYKHFAFVGAATTAYALQREAAFAGLLKQHNFAHHSYAGYRAERNLPPYTPEDADHLRNWLSSLPRPVGLMASNDPTAWAVTESCRDASLRVPDDIAILGVDNDEPICMTAYPPLSSVALAGERIGYEAAALLDRLLAGESAPTEPILVAPRGVVTRQSSDVLAIEDPELSRAVSFIREHVHESISVVDLLKAIPVARRSMERKFRNVLGRSPLEEIRRARIERARELLAATDLSMPVIAERSGFESAVRLTTVFRQETGITPTAYRRQFRLHELADNGHQPAAQPS